MVMLGERATQRRIEITCRLRPAVAGGLVAVVDGDELADSRVD